MKSYQPGHVKGAHPLHSVQPREPHHMVGTLKQPDILQADEGRAKSHMSQVWTKPGQVCGEVLAWVSYHNPLVPTRFVSLLWRETRRCVLCTQPFVKHYPLEPKRICEQRPYFVFGFNIIEVHPWEPGGSRLRRQGWINVELFREFQVLERELFVKPSSPRFKLDCHRLAHFVHVQDFPDGHRQFYGCFSDSALQLDWHVGLVR